ncbi:hypothetical protein XBJ1_4318 [Xenorhabdus bovienii SS-2004]|uniref:Uncharacterized protein n=1 Tax=Xenorhabdus bovienii (strain SS-2004) TaxID=406818 RepID=D3V6Z2_XENBS|nr:hypothetical protein XBJ1_4318 [Xenorhabdus bovienii SS-2004]
MDVKDVIIVNAKAKNKITLA